MEEKNQKQTDKHLGERHIGLPGANQEHTTHFVIHNQDKERQKNRDKTIEEGNDEKSKNESPPSSDAPMEMDNDETIGIP